MACEDALFIINPGAKITTSGTSANVAIPVASNGVIPRFVRIAATAAAGIRFGIDNTVVATSSDTQVQPGDTATLVVPRGCTYIAAIQVAAAGQVQISPLEN
jgi:hypothetical protein